MEEQKELIRKYIPTFRVEEQNYDREYWYLVYIDDVLVKTCGNDISTYLSGMVDAILLLKKDLVNN
jgi:hypothetical protein